MCNFLHCSRQSGSGFFLSEVALDTTYVHIPIGMSSAAADIVGGGF